MTDENLAEPTAATLEATHKRLDYMVSTYAEVETARAFLGGCEAICHELAALREAHTEHGPVDKARCEGARLECENLARWARGGGALGMGPTEMANAIESEEHCAATVGPRHVVGEDEPELVAFTAEPVPELVTLSEMITAEQAAERGAVLKELAALRDRLVALVGYAGVEPMQETIIRIETGDHRKGK